MKFAFKVLSLMLIPAFMLAMLGSGAMNADYAPVSSIPLSDHMPPCHAHGAPSLPVPPVDSSPRRLPTSYQCCLTDHAAVVVHASEGSQPPGHFTRMRPQIEPASAILPLSEHALQTIVLSDQPGTTPLRI